MKKALMESRYGADRKNLMYYQYVDYMVRALAPDANSVLDVGSASARYLENWDWIQDRTAIDLRRAYDSEKVKVIIGDFFEFQPPQKYDLVTCLQVLEHVPDAKAFARKLLSVSENVLISVPYKWPKGSNWDHVHDPVSLWKVRWWFGQIERYSIVVEEPLLKGPKRRRLICFFSKTKPLLRHARKRMREEVSQAAE